MLIVMVFIITFKSDLNAEDRLRRSGNKAACLLFSKANIP